MKFSTLITKLQKIVGREVAHRIAGRMEHGSYLDDALYAEFKPNTKLQDEVRKKLGKRTVIYWNNAD